MQPFRAALDSWCDELRGWFQNTHMTEMELQSATNDKMQTDDTTSGSLSSFRNLNVKFDDTTSIPTLPDDASTVKKLQHYLATQLCKLLKTKVRLDQTAFHHFKVNDGARSQYCLSETAFLRHLISLQVFQDDATFKGHIHIELFKLQQRIHAARRAAGLDFLGDLLDPLPSNSLVAK